jgi:pyridoxal phosphate phosphatase PHOSPHO2
MRQHPAMVRAVEKLKDARKTTFFCLSNANEIYIRTILQSKGLEDLFDEIVTNPAHWDDSGLLELRRRVDPTGPQHSCKVGCSPNMCKGTCDSDATRPVANTALCRRRAHGIPRASSADV